jgi:hypothetical protein
MQKFLFTLLLTLSGLLSVSNAHQQKEAYITLLFNERTGNLEVSHRFLLHDAEHGLAVILKGAGDLSVDEQTQQQFANYVQHNFALQDATSTALELITVGHEVDGKYFWVYQERSIPKTSELKLKHAALHELWPSQTNHINIEKDGWVKSVRLQKNDDKRWHSISVDKPE